MYHHSYKVRFTGNTVTLKDLLGDDKLGALNGLDSINLTYDTASINNFFTSKSSIKRCYSTINNTYR